MAYPFNDGVSSAIICAGGILKWIRHDNNMVHKDNGPAYLGYETEWLQDGHGYNIHRAIWVEKWYQNGRLHRTDGPAIMRYLNGDSKKMER